MSALLLFDLLFGLVALLMAFEWDRLCAAACQRAVKPTIAATWALFAAIAAVILAAVLQAHELALWLAVGGFTVVFLIARGIARRAPLLQALGALYIGVPYVALGLVARRSSDRARHALVVARRGVGHRHWRHVRRQDDRRAEAGAGHQPEQDLGRPGRRHVPPPQLVGIAFAAYSSRPRWGSPRSISAGLAVVAQAGDLSRVPGQTPFQRQGFRHADSGPWRHFRPRRRLVGRGAGLGAGSARGHMAGGCGHERRRPQADARGRVRTAAGRARSPSSARPARSAATPSIWWRAIWTAMPSRR